MESSDYWFPAKRYGFGWGLPATWQGWVVLFSYVCATIATSIFFPPSTDPVWFFGLLFFNSIVLLLVCFIKGEKPRWRWGKL